MGKKLNPSSMKISKQDERKQLNSLIKVLRPKVYITDSSSFKKLVQELTGFDGGNPIPSPPHFPLPPLHPVENFPVLDIQDDGIFQESSLEFSADSPQQSFPLTASTSSGSSSAKRETEFSVFRDMESWLLEIDQFQNYDSYAPLPHPEVCVYDYDLSGVM